jgi:hypothetical protein
MAIVFWQKLASSVVTGRPYVDGERKLRDVLIVRRVTVNCSLACDDGLLVAGCVHLGPVRLYR